MPRYERVDGVAYYRIRHQITMHTQDAQDKDAKRQARVSKK